MPWYAIFTAVSEEISGTAGLTDGQGTASQKPAGQLPAFLKSRMNRFRDRTGFLSEPSYLVVKVTCMNMMFLTPAFVRETAGTAFLD